MFGRLGHMMYRRRWYVLAVWLVMLVGAFTQARQVGSVLGPGDFTLKGSDSDIAARILNQKFHQNDQRASLVLIRNNALTVHDPAFARTVANIVSRIRADRSLRIVYLDNPLASRNTQLIARNQHAAAILFSSNLREETIQAQIERLRSLVKTSGYSTWVTGTPALNHDYAVQSERDLQKGEAITIPILIIILSLVFGTLAAAGLPLLLALFSIVLSLALVYGFGHYLDASIYVQNVVTVLGLGISIDYSLFIVYRFREELVVAQGNAERAVVRTMETAGRAVFFSGMTVALGLASLILTQLSFMESMGLGGMVVPFSAVLVALTLLPAVLGILGSRVNRLRVVPARLLQIDETGFWHSLATAIMRRPVISGGVAVIILLAIAFPTTHMALAYGGLKNAPQDVESVSGFLYMRSHFPSTPDPSQVVVEVRSGSVLAPAQIAGMRSLESTLRRDPEATRVVGPPDFIPASGHPSAAQRRLLMGRYVTGDLKTALFEVVPRNEVGTTANEELVRRIRTEAAAASAGVLRGDVLHVGGAAAGYIDFNDAMYSKFPLIIALVLLMTCVFLFFAFRSVFLPLKAVLLNLLSVGAAYGALQIVYKDGFGHQILQFTPEDGVAPWVPVFLFAFLFGLSMDYEVFLLSRIREHWLRTGNNRASVTFGLEKTGRLITSAAAIMVVAFSGFLIGHEIQLKEFGFGLMASIALDATLIRIVLVPSIMELLGAWNWWVPSFLHEFSRGGHSEHDVVAPVDRQERTLVEA